MKKVDGLYFKESSNRLYTEHVLNRVKSMPNYVEHAGNKLSNSRLYSMSLKTKSDIVLLLHIFFEQKVKQKVKIFLIIEISWYGMGDID